MEDLTLKQVEANKKFKNKKASIRPLAFYFYIIAFYL